MIGRPVKEALAVFVLCLAVYLSSGRLIPTDDAIPARHLPVAMLRHQTLSLDPFPALHASPRPYYLREEHGRLVSAYPIGGAIVAVPLYLDTLLFAADPDDAWLQRREKLAASAIVAVSVALMFLVLRRLTTRAAAVGLTAAYAFGSASLSSSSQAMWQHGAAQLMVTLLLYAWTRLRDGESSWWTAVAGAAAGMAIVCRPSVALITVPLVLALAQTTPRRLSWLAAGAALPAAVQLWYGQHYFGAPWHLQFAVTRSETWSTPFLEGLAGILVSPSRGLLVYSPIFALAGVGLARTARSTPAHGTRPGDRAVYLAAAGGILATLAIVGRWNMWWGGACYGPRLLADLSPTLTLLLVPAVPVVAASALRRACVAVLVAWSIGAHAIGAFCGDISWNVRRDVDAHPERLWSWRDNQPVECLRVLAGLDHAP